jgi:hypothetical protein
MATRRFPKASALNKEPYRLWFEFLKRAKARGLKVHKDYVEWGDTNMGFDRWWKSHGSKMFNIVANGVDVGSRATQDNSILLAHVIYRVRLCQELWIEDNVKSSLVERRVPSLSRTGRDC